MLIDFHTQAITMLLEGHEEDGVHRLYECLTIAKKWCEEGIPPQPQEEDEDMAVNAKIFEISLDEVIDDSGTQADLCTAVSMYRYLFGTDGITRIRNRATLIQLVAVITYNVAVTLHERGLACGDTTLVGRARSAYCFSLRILEHPSVATGDFDLSALELAILNNLGHVCNLFLDYEGLSRMRERMQTKLASVQPQTVCAYDFFHQSCLVSQKRPDSTLAPAA